MTGIFVSRKGGVMKPIRNLDLSAGRVAEGIWMGGGVREDGCVGEVAVTGDAGPLP